ncbi:hypothetical protein KDA00_04035 [Candidatus Saccharibacteria bacterium]|nr:hypothetical protein [Candidatus Saccharibacteria bacterium]
MRILKLSSDNQGFILPTIIGLMSIMIIVAYAALLQANNGLNLAYKQAYIQMARVASKAAVDYAKEQFDQTSCGDYNGTSETDLVTNDRYRITYKVEVIDTSADGYEKTVKGTGSVYLPKLSTTAQYVFDIRSEIVRTYAVCKTPDNFAPTVWLDASDPSTLKSSSTTTNTISTTTSFGNASDSTRDTLEERENNGSQTTNSWQSDDLEMHYCDSTEFSSSVCNNNNNKKLYAGMVFQGINIPFGSTVTSATIMITGGTPAGQGGNVSHRIYGLYNNSSDPHLPLFTSSGSNQIRNRITSSSLRTTAYTDISTNNFPPGNTTNFDVTAIVQELINDPNWSSSNGNIGFGIQRQSGNGTRRAEKNGIQLVVNYSSSGSITDSVNGGSVTQWQDKSGNGNHAQSAYGSSPTRQDNQINGQTVLRFSNGSLVSNLSSALNNKREMTVFVVANTNFSSSAIDGRYVSGMNTSSNNDTSSGSSIIPLLRYGSGTGFSSQYSGSSSSYRTNYSCGGSCSGTPYLFSSIFTIDENNTNNITTDLKGNGSPLAQKTGIYPSSNYTYSIDQFYYGGRRNGSIVGGSGADYMNGDYAEIIIYDKALECQQIEAIEEYLRAKWAISVTPYTSTCPATTVPTL